MKKEEYAEKYKTEQWSYCFKCGKGVFKDLRFRVSLFHNGKSLISCPEHYRFLIALICKLTDPKNERIRKGHKTAQESGASHQAALDGWNTRRERGTDIIGIEKMKQWFKDHPEKKKEYAQEAADTKRAHGDYDFDSMSEIGKKGWENSRNDPVRWEIKMQNMKAGQKRSKENGNFQNGREKGRQTFFDHYGLFSFIFPKFSLESQELFIALEENIPKNLTCYYAIKQNENFGTTLTNGRKTSGEYQVWVHGNRFCRFLDFYIKELNICIEFDEKWHEKAQDYDKERTSDILKTMPNIKILRVKKEDYLNDKDKVIKECVDFFVKTS